jgi:lipopolysaccharide transport protein LptA
MFTRGLAMAGLCACAHAAEPPPPSLPPAVPAPPALPPGTTDDIQLTGELTVITSDQLTYDSTKGFALFENNVVVSDPGMKMKTDRLTIHFAEKNDVKNIVAEGGVVMSQGDRKAWAQKATYNVATGEIVLEGNPRVLRGKDLLIGDRITFWRDENRMRVESVNRKPTMENPGARLILYPEKGSSPLSSAKGAQGSGRKPANPR